jgi:hypothetical protein
MLKKKNNTHGKKPRLCSDNSDLLKEHISMKKVMLPASSYDAASIVHTKSENHKGIGMSYFSEGKFLYAKSDAASIII